MRSVTELLAMVQCAPRWPSAIEEVPKTFVFKVAGKGIGHVSIAQPIG
jgi:hypothetical protein